MISVKEAEKIIQDNFPNYPPEKCHVEGACGRKLMENIFSDREQPPFHRVAMDGIAINLDGWKNGIRSFEIQGIQKAGQECSVLLSSSSCIEVMTGAMLPEGCDCVIKVEDIKLSGNKAELPDTLSPDYMQNVHQKGSDIEKGKMLIPEGTTLNPALISIIASFGKAEVLVARKPSIAVISTGDELVEPGEEVKPHQIRMSNSYAIQSMLMQRGYNTGRFHLADDKDYLYARLAEILNDFDILILSGGVSMGKFDFIPSVMADLGVEKIFHKIAQKPGKPFWFGKKSEKLVFALPGNPTSTLVCFYRYFLPLLEKRVRKIFVRLGEDITIKKGLTFFKPVKTKYDEHNVLRAFTVETNGSGDFCSLSESHGFVEIEAGKEFFAKDDFVPYYSWEI